MGGRATPDDPCAEKAHKKRHRQKKAKHRSYSKSSNRRRYDSQSPSSSSSSLSLSSSSSSSSYSSNSDSGSKSDRVRARTKDARSRRRREKHGGGRKRDRSGRKRDRPTSSRRVKAVSKRRRLDSSNKPQQETERGRQKKRTRSGREKHVSASRSSRSRSCSLCESRSSSSSRSSSRHGRRRRNTKIEETKIESQGAGKYDNRVEITQEFEDLSYSQSYNSEDGVKKLDSQDAKLPSPSSRKIASLDLVTDNAGREQLEHSSVDDGRSHHNFVHTKEQGCHADDDYPQSQSKGAGDVVTKLKSMVVAPTSVSEEKDLELVLRQRALENLRKFKRGNAATVRSSISVEDGQVQNRPDSSSPGISQLGVKDRSMPEKPTQYPIPKLASPDEKGATTAAQKKFTFSLEENFNDGTSPHGPIGKSVGKQPIQTSVSTAIGGMSAKLQHTNTSNFSSSKLPGNVRHLPSGSTSVRKGGQDSSNLLEPVSSNQCLLRLKTNQNGMVEKGSGCEPVNYGKEVDATKAGGPPSAAASLPGQPPDDSNEGKPNSETQSEDQLEKKTMTVMRGGEMVQVSYKVYIPKKTPALARRQLQR